MLMEAIKSILLYTSALIFGLASPLLTLITPMRQEVPQLLKHPTPPPILTEQTRELSKDEQATMSASFIKEFETMMASGEGERK